MVGSIACNLQQEHIVRLQAPQNLARQNELTANVLSSDVGSFDIGDPIDLSHIKLSSAERKHRLGIGLCVACGKKGHTATDNHRKTNSIPMPKRPSSYPAIPNFTAPVKHHFQHPHPTLMSAFHYPLCIISAVNSTSLLPISFLSQFLPLPLLSILNASKAQPRSGFAPYMMIMVPKRKNNLKLLM